MVTFASRQFPGTVPPWRCEHDPDTAARSRGRVHGAGGVRGGQCETLGSLAKHLDVMAHEGMHATTGSILGLGVRNIELKRNAI